mmetsp:Transcript_16344/g.25270  ORF Transcript_16344/g.25270 Transcript_16344/m.25270 type:complete len:97 (+) Transcript_16344:471-761(+)
MRKTVRSTGRSDFATPMSKSSGFSKSRTMRDAPPITNGLNNDQFFSTFYKRPKDMARKGGELSIDYGKIPFLREEAKKKRKRKCKSMLRNHPSLII